MQRLALQVGIENIEIHELRRTCGCRLLQDHRMNMAEVSKYLGHASIEQTERAYAFLKVENLHDALGGRVHQHTARQRLDEMFRCNFVDISGTLDGTLKSTTQEIVNIFRMKSLLIILRSAVPVRLPLPLNADEAQLWNELHAGIEMKRINHDQAYTPDGAWTNWAERYFSRLRRGEVGHPDHVAGPHLRRYPIGRVAQGTTVAITTTSRLATSEPSR